MSGSGGEGMSVLVMESAVAVGGAVYLCIIAGGHELETPLHVA